MSGRLPPPGAGRLGRWFGAIVPVTLVTLAGCTVSQGAHYQVDAQPWGSVYAHIYRLPTWLLLAADRSPTICIGVDQRLGHL